MISIIVCTPNPAKCILHKRHCLETCKTDHEYIMIDNSDNAMGICKAYNRGTQKASGDILLFLHDDVFFATDSWGTILETKFKSNPQCIAIGLAGTTRLSSPFWPSEERPFVQGKVIHELGPNKEPVISLYSQTGSDVSVAAIDGLFIAVRKKAFSEGLQFDEKTFDRFHLYDMDISLQLLNHGEIFVTHDILAKHLSVGKFKEEWKKYAELFMQKYTSEMPKTIEQKQVSNTPITPWENVPLKKVCSAQTFEVLSNLGHF